MSQTAIPIEFEKYLQNKISTGQAPDMNEMIFAYLPDLDLSQEIDRTTGLPDITYWVHQQDIDQVGKLGDNALVYSVVIPGSVAEFTFNAIYLRDKNTVNSCGMVVHKADETKEAGMASTKSLVQQYTGAAQIAGITVDAATWQIDYQARLSGIENDIRLAWLDYYGHTAFINGYDVIQQADKTKFKITAGIAYVGGLRAVLENDVIQTLSTLPTALYLDVVRQGTVLSVWSNQVSVVSSENELADYVDGNNQQHYVAKIADIAAGGSVRIDRPLSEMEAHLQAENPHPQYAKKDAVGNTLLNKLDKTGTAADSNKLGGVDADKFLRSDINDTFTSLNGTSIEVETSNSRSEVKEKGVRVYSPNNQPVRLGFNDTWQIAELTSSGAMFPDGTLSYRTIGVNYNAPDHSPIELNIEMQNDTTLVSSCYLVIDGKEYSRFSGGGDEETINITIPAGCVYKLVVDVGPYFIRQWSELGRG